MATNDSCKGVYKNPRLMHACTTIVGFTVHLQTADGSVWEGIFNTFSPEFTICLDYAIQIDPKLKCKDSLYAALKSGLQVKSQAFFELKDIVRISVADAATKDMAKLTTDADISGYDGSKSQEHKELESWQDDDGDSLLSCNDVSLDNNKNENQNARGWDAQDMFRYNERVHNVTTTYDEKLTDYTLPLPKHSSKEWRKKQEQAAAIAKEIESSSKSQGRLAKEDEGDCEEEKFSAVIRPQSEATNTARPRMNGTHRGFKPRPDGRFMERSRIDSLKNFSKQLNLTSQPPIKLFGPSPPRQPHNQLQPRQPQQQSQSQQQHHHHHHHQQQQQQPPSQSPQQQQQQPQQHQQPHQSQLQQQPQPQQHQHHQQQQQQPQQQPQPQPQQHQRPQPKQQQPQLQPTQQPGQQQPTQQSGQQQATQQQPQQQPLQQLSQPQQQPQQHLQQQPQPHQQLQQQHQQHHQQQLQQQPPQYQHQLQQQQPQLQPHQQPPHQQQSPQQPHQQQSTQQPSTIASSTTTASSTTAAPTVATTNVASSQVKDHQKELARNSTLNPNAKEFVYNPRSPANQVAQTNIPSMAPQFPTNYSPMSQAPYAPYYQPVTMYPLGIPPHQQQHHAAQFMPNYTRLGYMPPHQQQHQAAQFMPNHTRLGYIPPHQQQHHPSQIMPNQTRLDWWVWPF